MASLAMPDWCSWDLGSKRANSAERNGVKKHKNSDLSVHSLESVFCFVYLLFRNFQKSFSWGSFVLPDLPQSIFFSPQMWLAQPAFGPDPERSCRAFPAFSEK